MGEQEDGWWRFVDLCSQLNKQELSQLLQFFLTATEVEEIGKRTLLVSKLLQGKQTQREIAADLGISITLITRGSNELKRVDQQLKALLQKALT